MTGLVYVNEEGNSLIDEWLNDGASENLLAHDADVAVADNAHNTSSKGGLGFSGKSKLTEPKIKIDNGLVAKKRSQSSILIVNDEEDEGDLHGVVEDIIESRTSIPEKSAMKTNFDENIPKKPKNKKKKHKTGLAENESTSLVSVAQEAGISTTNQQDGIGKAMESDNKETDPNRPNSRVRKRTKARSKQKNIRRDNRLESEKPAYLLVGSKDYKGRPLTEKTKTLLVK